MKTIIGVSVAVLLFFGATIFGATSSDDEGNDFNEVYYEPSIGHYQKEASKGSFVSLKEFQEWGLTESDVNSVCIN
jgi:hypothetical protein